MKLWEILFQKYIFLNLKAYNQAQKISMLWVKTYVVRDKNSRGQAQEAEQS